MALRLSGPAGAYRGRFWASRPSLGSRTPIIAMKLSSLEERGSYTPLMSDMYRSILTQEVLGGSSVLLESPLPDIYSFAATEAKGRTYCANYDDICDEEVSYGIEKETRNTKGTLNEKRLNRFIGGRVALRRALRAIEAFECNMGNLSDGNSGNDALDKCSLVQEIGPILADAHGAPNLPQHVHGSISHKDNLGVGVAIIDSSGRVGCDIERCTNSNAAMLAKRVLTDNERKSLGPIVDTDNNSEVMMSCDVQSIEEDIMLRFSFKEAVFKAIHPYLARQVDFDEVEVYPKAGGKAEVFFKFRKNLESEFLSCNATWYRYTHDDLTPYFITFAHSHSPDGSADPNKSKR